MRHRVIPCWPALVLPPEPVLPEEALLVVGLFRRMFPGTGLADIRAWWQEIPWSCFHANQGLGDSSQIIAGRPTIS